MGGYFCIGFIYFISKSKSLLDCTNLFSLNEYGNNDKIIQKYIQRFKALRQKKSIVSFGVSLEKLKILKYSFVSKKH